MKVALVHDSLVQFGGAEKVLKVLADMFPDAPIYTSIYNKEVFQSIFPHNRIRSSLLQNKPAWLRKRYKWMLPFLPTAFEEFDFSGYDLVISSSSSFAKGIVVPSSTTHISYCHTPTRFLWDSYHSYLKEQGLRPPLRFFVKLLLNKIRVWDMAAAQRVDYFLANSKNTQKRIEKFYRRESKLIYPPVEVKAAKLKDNHANFFLIVSRLEKYKQVDVAVKAFNQIPTRRLVIIGEGSQRNYLERIAGKNIQILGFKNDSVVQQYYQNCQAFIATARDEDFGITPIEAMAHGKPVLAFKDGGYKESVVPGVTGQFYTESTPQSMLEGLVKLLEQNFVPRKIREHALKFDTQVYEETLRNFIESVTASRSAL